ncbi:class I SAM-dependent methyltransferase [Ferruginibacter albus]|uniref:class I SAM-dependent methyltransferase n=1 Tax=Ferruginibacter albus TaxID=2875540 RepID=UPI001CC6C4CC|nr:methyltransferase domain-containing protein [Ferruginibacter albus]UAY51984.1 class I SAM-dependent methyltransferase [Ferruginibacter albus]
MDTVRKPFQGVINIIRFNWHFYLISVLLLTIGFVIANNLVDPFKHLLFIALFLVLLWTIVSLLVSFYIYDLSGLYKLNWLNNLPLNSNDIILNIHAGFDETSLLLKHKFSNSDLIVLDFYNPELHTEISIKRARKAYPSYPGTKKTTTQTLNFPDNYADKIFLIFSAHEIRNEEERIDFFKELNRIVKPSGSIVVTEHLRNIENFLAYNIGFFHFYSKASWLKLFCKADLKKAREIKLNPFIITFILQKNGITS